jgi:hypothetical protein
MVGALALVCASASAGASAGRGDVSATGAYLRTAVVFARAQETNVGASIAVMEAQVSVIASGCPGVLGGAPQGSQLSALKGEIAATVLFSSIAPDRSATLAFVSKIDALHWSNGTVAKLVRELAAEERAGAKLVLPDVCADLDAWKTSGYRTLSSNTTAFLMAAEAVGKETHGVRGKKESLEEAVLRHLRVYETADDRRLALQVERVGEAAGKRLLTSYSAALSRVGKALGIEPS